ncbi:MAG TPA: EscU/YscU/HrcU family type III secretion system export apparatus switch protein, partial [Burkholderiaceae bacterium]|nr:EscU/YscU/HrcU family type III secretion system export apparatus switch protein [Burkholderiaceae bacterium]
LIDSAHLIKLSSEMIIVPSQLYEMNFRDAAAIEVTILLRTFLELLLPYILLVIVIGVFAETVQSGILFSFKALMPKGDKLNPVSNLKQMFSMKNIIEFLKSNLKVLFLTALVYFVIRDSFDPLLKAPADGIGAVGIALGIMMKKLVIYTFVGFGALAFFDLIYQRHSYTKSLMMSMEEIKQEHKQMEGDPHTKSHRRELAKEIAMGEMVEETRKASVVVTNPTHLAIALYYADGKTPLPIVIGMGQGLIAKQIVRVAKEENIPVMQNIPVARALMKTAKIGQYIPSELVEPVAEVLLAIRHLMQEQQGHFNEGHNEQ